MPGLILLCVVLGLIAAAALSRVVLAQYNRAVLASMRETRGSGIPAAASADGVTSGSCTTPLQIRRVDGPDVEAAPSAFTFADRRRRRLVGAFVVAGMVHAFVAAFLVAAAVVPPEQEPFTAQRILILWALLAWPVIPSAIYVGALGRGMLVVGALVILSLVLATEPAFLFTALYLVGVPLLGTWTLSARRARAIAPFVFVGVFTLIFLLFFALQASIAIGNRIGSDVFPLTLSIMIATTLAVGVLCGYALLSWRAHRYRAKRTSDLLLLVDSWWFAYTLWICMVLSQEWGLGGFLGLSAFAGYELALLAQLRGHHRRGGRRGLQLLLLRVFGFRRRTEDLLAKVGHLWRYIGNIRLIAGPDVVTVTLEPHETVEYLSGRLSRRFLRDREDLERRIEAQDLEPDPDGRFRVNQFFCQENSWRATLQRLAADADVVLMDLRSFSSSNKGCEYELEQLLRLVPLDKVLLMADQTTDEDLLARMIQDKWVMVGRTSVNAGNPAPTIRLMRGSAGSGPEATNLVTTMCGMVREESRREGSYASG